MEKQLDWKVSHLLKFKNALCIAPVTLFIAFALPVSLMHLYKILNTCPSCFFWCLYLCFHFLLCNCVYFTEGSLSSIETAHSRTPIAEQSGHISTPLLTVNFFKKARTSVHWSATKKEKQMFRDTQTCFCLMKEDL